MFMKRGSLNNQYNKHCLKSVRIRSYSGPYFSAFGVNMERYGAFLHIQSECGKIRTRITPNTDTFHLVEDIKKTTLLTPTKNWKPSFTTDFWLKAAHFWYMEAQRVWAFYIFLTSKKSNLHRQKKVFKQYLGKKL